MSNPTPLTKVYREFEAVVESGDFTKFALWLTTMKPALLAQEEGMVKTAWCAGNGNAAPNRSQDYFDNTFEEYEY